MQDKLSKGVILKLRVIPNSSAFKLLEFDETQNELRIKVCSPAQKGKANKEIIQKLGKIFGSKVKIIKGEKSNKKLVAVEANREAVLAKLSPQKP